MVETPIYTGTVANCRVRFFAPPKTDGTGEFPWVSFDDLLVACAMPPDCRDAYLRAVWHAPGNEAQRLATPDGPVVVVDHFVGQGVLGAAAHHGHCHPKVEREYVEGAVTALGVLMAGASVERILAFLAQAARRGRTG